MAEDWRSPDDVPLPEGYTLVRKLGSGGFATVWLAEQGRLGRRVAVKLLGETLEDAERQRRFLAECRAIGRLSGHPAVVTVHDAGTTDEGHPYLVMEHLPGGSLHDRLVAGGALPWPEVLTVGVHVADALSAAHDAGILHRDVKPANVLLDDTGTPKLGDFGIARLSEGTATAAGNVLGTIAYTPPEVFSGRRAAPSGDVWALGATLYTLLAGANPFVGGHDESPAAIIARVIRSDPAPLPESVPPDLAELVRGMLRVIPEDRPQSAAEVARRLQALQADHGFPGTPARSTREVVDSSRSDSGDTAVGFAPVVPGPPTAPTVAGPVPEVGLTAPGATPPPVPGAPTPDESTAGSGGPTDQGPPTAPGATAPPAPGRAAATGPVVGPPPTPPSAETALSAPAPSGPARPAAPPGGASAGLPSDAVPTTFTGPPPPVPKPDPNASVGATAALGGGAASPPIGRDGATSSLADVGPAEPGPPVPGPTRRRGGPLLLVGAAVILLVVLTAVVLFVVRGDDDTAAETTTTGESVTTTVPGQAADEVDSIWGVLRKVPTGPGGAPSSVTPVVEDVDCGGLLRCAAVTVDGDAVVAYPEGDGVTVHRIEADGGSEAWSTPVATQASNVSLAVAGDTILLVTTEDDPDSDDPANTLRTYRGFDGAGNDLWGQPTFFPSSVGVRRAADQASEDVSVLTANVEPEGGGPAQPGAIGLDNAEGTVLWTQVGRVVATDRMSVYQSLGGGIGSIDISTGNQGWTRRDVPILDDGASSNRLGVVVDRVLVTLSEGNVIGLQVDDGGPAWPPVPLAADGVDIGTPSLVSTAGGLAVVLADGGDLAVDPTDGSLRWRQNRDPLLQGEGTTVWAGTASTLVAGRLGAPLRLLPTEGDGAGTEAAVLDLPAGPTTLSSLSFEGGVAILTDAGLIAYSTDDLSELWSDPATAGVATAVTVDGGVVTLGPDGIALRQG